MYECFFLLKTQPKEAMARKRKEFSPVEKRIVINIFVSGNSITEIGRLLTTLVFFNGICILDFKVVNTTVDTP